MNFHLKAISFGIAADLAVTVISSLALFLSGVTSTNQNLLAWSLILGFAAVGVGGYVTARYSPSSKLANTVIYGISEILIGLFIATWSPVPLWFDLAGIVLTVPVALVGALAALRTTSGTKH